MVDLRVSAKSGGGGPCPDARGARCPHSQAQPPCRLLLRRKRSVAQCAPQLSPPCFLPTLSAPAVCSYCRQLGEVYGIPKVHYKGQQDDFYIMVRNYPCARPPSPVPTVAMPGKRLDSAMHRLQRSRWLSWLVSGGVRGAEEAHHVWRCLRPLACP